jgi:hypothetical protein
VRRKVETRNIYNILVAKLKYVRRGTHNLEDLGVDETIILKLVLEKLHKDAGRIQLDDDKAQRWHMWT